MAQAKAPKSQEPDDMPMPGGDLMVPDDFPMPMEPEAPPVSNETILEDQSDVEEPAPQAQAPAHVTDPEPLAAGEGAPTEPPLAAPPLVTVIITKNEDSVVVGDAHFSLRAGSVMQLFQPVSDELIRRRLARLP